VHTHITKIYMGVGYLSRWLPEREDQGTP